MFSNHKGLCFPFDYATIIEIPYTLWEKIMRVFRIVCCILSCLSVAATVPVGIFCGELVYILIPIALAALFAMLMVFAKKKSEPRQPAETDFMNTDEENAAIREEEDNKE